MNCVVSGVSAEVTDECVVPVQHDNAVLTEVEAGQVCRCKHSVSVRGSSDGVLEHGKAPWIMRLKDGRLVWCGVAKIKRVINSVTGDLLIAVWLKAKGQPRGDQDPAAR